LVFNRTQFGGDLQQSGFLNDDCIHNGDHKEEDGYGNGVLHTHDITNNNDRFHDRDIDTNVSVYTRAQLTGSSHASYDND
jgi:hypothetical protein